ncbi:MAG: hypothetical protein IKT46_00210 [Clostridia bacterium]|nr:hypothetical protein [Clostridia bacterium]
MEEIFTEVAKDTDADIELRYSIISSVDAGNIDRDLNKVYSLLIIAISETWGNDSLLVYDISRTAQRAVEIARLMCQNTVTPCTAYDILDDIL